MSEVEGEAALEAARCAQGVSLARRERTVGGLEVLVVLTVLEVVSGASICRTSSSSAS